MNTIYNIYEELYNSILDKTNKKVGSASKVVKNVMDSYKERFIKIITLAAQLNESQEDIFRNMVEDAISCHNANYIECQIPKDLMGYLINSSKNQLTPADFKGFPNNKKEWEFRTSIWSVHFSSTDERLNRSNLLKIPENTVFNYVYNVVRFKNTIIIQARNFICVWIDGLHKVYGYFTPSANKGRKPLQ